MPAAIAVGELMSALSTFAPSARTLGSFMLADTPRRCQLSVSRVPRFAMYDTSSIMLLVI